MKSSYSVTVSPLRYYSSHMQTYNFEIYFLKWLYLTSYLQLKLDMCGFTQTCGATWHLHSWESFPYIIFELVLQWQIRDTLLSDNVLHITPYLNLVMQWYSRVTFEAMCDVVNGCSIGNGYTSKHRNWNHFNALKPCWNISSMIQHNINTQYACVSCVNYDFISLCR